MTAEFDHIIAKLKNPSDDIRIKGCIELSESGHPKARKVLRQLIDRDASPRVRYAIRKLLDLVERKNRARSTQSEAPPATGDGGSGNRLAEHLASPDREIRLRAVKEIERTGPKSLIDPLLTALDREADPKVQSALVKAVGSVGDGSHVQRLAPFLRDQNSRVRANAVEALLMLPSPLSLALVFPLLQDPDHRVRANASRALTARGETTALKVLKKMCESNQLWMRDSAAYALGELENPDAVPLLIGLYSDRNASVRDKAQRGLTTYAEAGDENAKRFIAGLGHRETQPESAAELMEVIEDAKPVLDELKDPNPKLRMNIVNEIISNKDTTGLGTLIDHLAEEENVFVTSRIIAAIGLLGSEDPRRYRAVLLDYLQHHDDRTVANTVEAATRLGDTSLRDAIRPLLKYDNARIRGNALLYLRDDPAIDLPREISGLVVHPDIAMQQAAVFVVERLAPKKPGLVSQLSLLSTTSNGELFYSLCESLERMAQAGVPSAKVLLSTLRDGEDHGLRGRSMIRLDRPAYMKRVFAQAVDATVSILAGLILAFIILKTTGDSAVSLQSAKQLAASNLFLVGFACCIFYFVRDGFFGGRGFGKKLIGLRIININTGEGCSFFRSLLRQATLGVVGLNIIEIIMPAVDPRGQRLIDKLLDTQVIEEVHKDMTRWQNITAWIGLVFIALFVTMAIRLIALNMGL